MTEASEQKRTNNGTLRLCVAAFFVCLVFVLGVVLRVAAMNEPLWLDELHTSWCVSGSLADVFQRARLGNQSPLFFYAEFLSVSILGHTETALRLPSLIASVTLLVSIPWIVFRLSGSLVGAGLAMLLATIDDNFLFYAVEARPYALVQLVSVWQVYFFVRCLMPNDTSDPPSPKNRWPLAGWLALTVVLFYLHYTTISFIATEFLCLCGLWCYEFRRKNRIGANCNRSMLLAFGLSLLLMLPGIWMLLQVGQHRSDWNSMVSASSYGLMMVAHFCAYLLPALMVGFFYRRRSIDRGTCLLLFVLGWLFALPTFFSFVGSVTQLAPLGHYRFSIASSTILIVLAGVVFRILNSRPRKLLAFAITIGLATVTNPLAEPMLRTGQLPAQRYEGWNEASDLISQTGGAVVLCSNLVEDERDVDATDEAYVRYLKFPLTGIYRPDSMPESQVIAAAIQNQVICLPGDERERVQIEPAFWLLVRGWPDEAGSLAMEFCDELNRDDITRWQFQQSSELKSGPLSLFRFKRAN